MSQYFGGYPNLKIKNKIKRKCAGVQQWLGEAGIHVYSAQGTDKSCGIHAWLILINVSCPHWLRPVIMLSAVLNTRSHYTLAAGQVSTSKADKAFPHFGHANPAFSGAGVAPAALATSSFALCFHCAPAVRWECYHQRAFVVAHLPISNRCFH